MGIVAIVGQLISLFSKGPAIQNLENFDMIVQMKDGGVLLPIVCSKHLDDSDQILNLLQTKVENYLKLIDSTEFKEQFPDPAYVQIELLCIKKPDQRILDQLDCFQQTHADGSLCFSWKK